MAEQVKPKTQFLQRNQKNYSNPDLNTKSAVNFDRTFLRRKDNHVKFIVTVSTLATMPDVLKAYCINVDIGKSFA